MFKVNTKNTQRRGKRLKNYRTEEFSVDAFKEERMTDVFLFYTLFLFLSFFFCNSLTHVLSPQVA